MKIKFLADFRGRETNEVMYFRGDEVELSDGIASRLIADGRAELVHVAEILIEKTEELPVEQPVFKRKRGDK